MCTAFNEGDLLTANSFDPFWQRDYQNLNPDLTAVNQDGHYAWSDAVKIHTATHTLTYIYKSP